MANTKRKFHLLLHVVEPSAAIENYCRRHKIELNILSMPLAKACLVCGKSQPLQRWEIFWPALRPGSQALNRIWGSRAQRLSHSFRAMIFALLIAGGFFLAWQGFRRGAPHLDRQLEIQGLNSSAPTIVDTPTDAGQNKTRETATIPRTVALGAIHQGNWPPEAQDGFSARFVQPE